jgi:hypothetical protein
LVDAWLDSIDVALRVKGGKARQGKAGQDEIQAGLTSQAECSARPRRKQMVKTMGEGRG